MIWGGYFIPENRMKIYNNQVNSDQNSSFNIQHSRFFRHRVRSKVLSWWLSLCLTTHCRTRPRYHASVQKFLSMLESIVWIFSDPWRFFLKLLFFTFGKKIHILCNQCLILKKIDVWGRKYNIWALKVGTCSFDCGRLWKLKFLRWQKWEVLVNRD